MGRVFPKRTKSLPVIAATRPRWPTCWLYCKDGWAKLKMLGGESIVAWPSPRTWQRSKRPVITGWWPQLSRSGSAILTNMKSRLARGRSREKLPRAMKGQHKVRLLVKPAQSPDGSQGIALCWSESRMEKDCAIRQKQEIRFLAGIEELAKRIAVGRTAAKIYEAIAA